MIYGDLKVIRFSRSFEYRAYWICLCKCGKEHEVASCNLKNGGTTSCGCNKLKVGKNTLLNSIFSDYRTRATRKNQEFKLDINEFEILLNKPCYYCGEFNKNTKKRKNRNYSYNGIDRINNNEGYTLTNSVTCCKVCNMAKNTMTQIEFIEWIKKVYNNTFQWNYN